MEQKEYFAFISYKREDEKWATWLQHKLEHYKLPTSLNGQENLPKYIRPIFKDTSELSAGLLADEIKTALDRSKFLIVICSPNSSKSKWVNKEALSFINSGRVDRIIPFIIDGEPFSDSPEVECFPQAIRELPEANELLGVNIKDMGRDAAAIKVIAHMFGLQFDTLWQRHEREKNKRRLIIVGVSLVITLLSIITLISVSKLNWKLLAYQSRVVAKDASSLLAEGDPYMAMKLVAEVLPIHPSHPNRPIVPEAVNLLRQASDFNVIKIPSKPILGRIDDVAISPDGRIMVIGSDGNITLWDIYSGCELFSNVRRRHEGGLMDETCVAFNPNGKEFASGGCDGVIRVWNAESGEEIYSISAFTEAVQDIAYSCDGEQIIASGGHGFLGNIGIWDNHLVRDTTIIFPTYDRNISTIQFSPDGKRIAFAANNSNYLSNDNRIRIWDALKKKEIAVLSGHSSMILRVVFSPDGSKLVSGDLEGNLKVWDLSSNRLERNLCGAGTQIAHEGKVSDIVFDDSNPNIVYSSSDDGTIKGWDILSGENIQVFSESEFSKVTLDRSIGIESLAISSDGTLVAGTDNGYCRIRRGFDTMHGSIVETEQSPITIVAFDPNFERMLTASKNGKMMLWDIDIHVVIETAELEDVTCFAFDKEGNNIVVGTSQGIIAVYDSNLTEKARIEWPHTWIIPNGVIGISFSSDGKTLIAYSHFEIAAWDIASQNMIWNYSYCEDDSFKNVIAFQNEDLLWVWLLGDSLQEGVTKSPVTIAIDPDLLEDYFFIDIRTGQIDMLSAKITSKKWGVITPNGLISPRDGLEICAIDNGAIKVYSISNDNTAEESYRFEAMNTIYTCAALNTRSNEIVAGDTDGNVYFKPFLNAEELIISVRERFSNNWLTNDEKAAYYIE